MTKTETRLDQDVDRVGRAGTQAWKRLQKSKDWSDWMAVGEALMTGRQVAMRGAGVNAPEGRGYVELFSQWLIRYKLDSMDKSARAKLLQVMTNRMEIEAYRSSLTLTERMRLNHPTVMLRHWQKAHTVPKPKKPRREQEALQAHVDELEAGREPLTLEGARKAYAALLFDLDRVLILAEIEQLKTELGVEDTLSDLDNRLAQFP